MLLRINVVEFVSQLYKVVRNYISHVVMLNKSVLDTFLKQGQVLLFLLYLLAQSYLLE